MQVSLSRHTHAHTLCPPFCLLWEPPQEPISNRTFIPWEPHLLEVHSKKKKKKKQATLYQWCIKLPRSSGFCEALLKIHSVAAHWLSDILHRRRWITSCVRWGQWGPQPLKTKWNTKAGQICVFKNIRVTMSTCLKKKSNNNELWFHFLCLVSEIVNPSSAGIPIKVYN